MSLLKDYQADPCGACSIPYWKHKSITLPADMKILHEREFSEVWLRDYTDEPYFRIYHTLEKVEATNLDEYRGETAVVSDIPCIVRIINDSYANISVTCDQIRGYTKTEVYQPALWIKAVHCVNGKIVGCGMADFDSEMQEGIIEWIQVLPEYRGKKIGQMLVNDLLLRMKPMARFATVSGQVNNRSSPEKLYRKCGFVGNDVWHILRKKT